MWLYPPDARKYEDLAEYMSRKLPYAYLEKSIAYALEKMGQFDRKRLRNALKWGQQPTVKVRDLKGDRYGEFTPRIGSNEIRISRKRVEEFEAGKGLRQARNGKVYVIGVTLLHELVHWCDDQDGIEQHPSEEGLEFEKMVYGSTIW
ncbi:MAG: hypothetical protein JKY37_22080 [Nannocystaceae bacterium]|nr:hypothetical protein [Nannocystaceae bacterium]